jgi:membrane protein implicated in regulation of membrane protease activity
MEVWMLWVVAGIICIIVEIFTPGFFFMSLGVSAIITGLLALFIEPVYWHFVIFILVSFLLFINLRKLGEKLVSNKSKPTNVSALIGKIGKITVKIPIDGKGYVKIGGEEWPAMEINNLEVEVGSKVIVKKIDGNKVIVEEKR